MSNHYSPIQSLSLLVSAAVVLGLAGCDADDQEPIDPELADLEPDTVEIVENLLLAGYPRSEIEIGDDEVVLVGGDAVVSLEASREMAALIDDDEREHEHDSFRQYHTTNLVGSSVEVICLDFNALYIHPYFVVGVQQAMSDYNELDLSFTFMPYDMFAPCDAVITFSTQSGTSSQAGFPSGGLPYGSITMGTGTTAYGLDVTRHVIMHELGHTVGLRHNDWADRSLSCGTGGSESTNKGAIYIPGTLPSIDPLSVMNACYNSSSAGVFSAFDQIALLTLY